MQALTDFADQAVVLPLVLALVLGAGLGGWWRGALRWGLVVGITLGMVALAKLLVFVRGAPLGIASPSGHAASAVVVYGGAALLLSGSRLFGIVFALLFGAAIAWSRLALGVHTPVDLAAGLSIGGAGLAALIATLGRPEDRLRPWASLLLGLSAVIGFHGTRLPAEAWLRSIAQGLAGG